MKQNKISKYIGIALFLLSIGSCDLQKDPLSDYSDVTYEENTQDLIKYPTRDKIKQQYDAMYNSVRGNMELLYVDYIVYSDVHADNAYRGGGEGELFTLEKHTQDGVNKNVRRDWNSFLSLITTANRVICNIDQVPDPALTQSERNQWKAEALILRAWMLFDMTRLWGEIPVVVKETPDITADNFDAIAPLLFPKREAIADVYKQIIEDLTFAEQNAPNLNSGNKFIFSKIVAKSLLAKVYAEKPIRDYNKTIKYCDEVMSSGVSLVPDYSTLYGWNAKTKEPMARNTSESIFEIVFQGSGNWTPMMFGLVLNNPNSTYDWQKWVTPSRDLVRAFNDENDEIRKSETIVAGQPSWSQHYPSDEYLFMYKNRSEFNSIIKLRLADIMLLKAEALVSVGKLLDAATVVNQVRARVKLPALESSIQSNASDMKLAVLKERRLELAFEGQRWFDLVRNDMALEVLNSLNSRDEGRVKQQRITQERLILPVPQEQIDNNKNLSQNPGY